MVVSPADFMVRLLSGTLCTSTPWQTLEARIDPVLSNILPGVVTLHNGLTCVTLYIHMWKPSCSKVLCLHIGPSMREPRLTETVALVQQSCIATKTEEVPGSLKHRDKTMHRWRDGDSCWPAQTQERPSLLNPDLRLPASRSGRK